MAIGSIVALTETLMPVHFSRVKSINLFLLLNFASKESRDMFGVIRISLSFLPVVRFRMSQTVPCRSLRLYALLSSESDRILCRIRSEDPATDPDTARFHVSSE